MQFSTMLISDWSAKNDYAHTLQAICYYHIQKSLDVAQSSINFVSTNLSIFQVRIAYLVLEMIKPKYMATDDKIEITR